MVCLSMDLFESPYVGYEAAHEGTIRKHGIYNVSTGIYLTERESTSYVKFNHLSGL